MAVRVGTRNVFTVDLEEWFHVCGVGGELAPEHWDRLPARVEQTTRVLLDLLDALQVRATFFVVGWVGDRYPRLIEAVLAAGHEIGSHGYHHTRAYDLGPDAFRQDLRASVRALAAAGAARVTMFRAPEWSINDRSFWALEILVEEGITVDASMAPVRLVGAVTYPRHPHLRQTPAGPITEVPPLVVDRFGQTMPMGWGWGLRMSSPRRVLRAIEAVNHAGVPAVLMVHPWELDPDPPRVRLPARLQFAHYFRLNGFRDRLRDVLRAVPFGGIGDMAGALVP
jgi:polysaccharide deacetylase family protein (PEP-CTERM system associated)